MKHRHTGAGQTLVRVALTKGEVHVVRPYERKADVNEKTYDEVNRETCLNCTRKTCTGNCKLIITQSEYKRRMIENEEGV